MDDDEIFDTLNASGSAYVKFNVELLKHEEIKQGNLYGWDAAA